jgi:urease accessory protein
MLTVTKLLPQAQGLSPVLVRRAAALALDWPARQTPPAEASDALGRTLRLQLPPGSALREGDVLVGDDGSLLRVHAAAEPVWELRAPSTALLLRAAYELGQRHLPLVVHDEHLTLRPAPALAPLLQALALQVDEAHGPFEPAPPLADTHAHRHADGCGHDHDHDHDHDHSHGHGHGHSHHDHGKLTHHADATTPADPGRGRPVAIAVRSEPAAHVHGPGCGHDHHDGGHDHDHGHHGHHGHHEH